jgi:hypothetical protein
MKKLIISIFGLIFLTPFLAFGQESDLFKVKTPNVMVIFDTSSSMEMSVNVNTKGESIWTNQYGPDKVTQYRKDGNHPDSRLYQAKKALSEIIDQVVKDKVNLGFSTYAQEKIEKWRGQYKRDVTTTTPEAWRRYKRYYVWGTTNDGTRYANSIYPDSFVDAWGITHSSVTVGTTFNRAIYIHNKSGPLHPQVCSSGADCIGGFKATNTYTITYKVTARTLNPETNVYTFTYAPITPKYDYYWEKYFYDSWSSTIVDCGSDKKGAPWAETKSDSGMTWYTHFSDDSPPTEYNTPSNGRTAGWWSCKVQYQAPSTTTTTTYYWDNTTGSSCDATKAGTPVWDLVPGTCFDWSGYKYTPEGTTSRPHTWAYFKKDGSNYWKKSLQPDPFYPALPGNPGENNNHHFFINFPDDKDPLFKDSDRTTIKNTIMSYLDLTPVKRPDASEYWTKLPVHAIQGKKGLTANVDPLNPYAFNIQRQTPLADSLAWSYTYFDDYINKYNGGDPSSKEVFGETICRGNYIILLTDGLESCRFDKDGNPDYTAAVTEAGKLYGINVKTFVIGFGSDIVGNKTILNNIALAGSGGKYNAFFAADFEQLKEALRSIFQLISGQYYGRSNPVITRKRDRLYRGNFDIKDGDYMGHLMAWDADPKTGVLAPDFVWDSGEQITINDRGKVYTWTDTGLNPSRKEFKASESSLYPLVYPAPRTEDINGDSLYDDNDAITIINYTLDPNYDGGKYKGKRAINVDIKGTSYSSWKLGDVYHSTPVVIAEPAFYFGTENNYNSFYSTYAGREVMIYVGTNDGMLHGFKNTDGNEKFAIIPKCLLGKLKNLKLSHDFYVDSSPKAYDVYFQSESKWKTVLISGLRGGGPYYFAVDVTDPNDPKILWEWPNPVNDPVNTDPVVAHLGETWGKPDIGRVKVGGITKFVAFVTGGYLPSDNRGNSFHIIDIETGKALKSFIVGNASNKIPSGPTAYDAEKDSFVNYVYFGDIQGTLWKVDVSSTNIADWTLYEFWKDEPPKRSPIFYTPTVAKNDEGKTLIFFGTGDEFNLTSTAVNYFYEIEDQGATGKQNWTRNLDPGEKVLASPSVANWVVYFTTWVYTGGSEYCGAGEGRLYGLKISKVGAPGASEGLVTLDPVTGKWTAPQNYISLGAGIPSAPLVTNGMIYIGTSLNANKVIQIPIPGWLVSRIRAWREVF